MKKDKLICGVDIGGTKLAVALFKQDGRLVEKKVVHDHSNCNGDELVKRIATLLKEIFESNNITGTDILGIGLALAGHILFREGKIITTSNFPKEIRNFPFVEKLGAYFPGVRIILDNDANAQAFGEYKFGAGSGYNNLVFITVSTGIGGGIIINGHLVRGKSGTAGEIGHMIVDADSDIKCTCGNYGCSMAQASGLFFPNLYKRHLQNGMKSSIDITEETVDKMNGYTVHEGLQDGDAICRKIVEDSADIVGLTIYNVFQILNPELIILGGGLMYFGEEYIKRIKDKFVHHTQKMMYEPVEIKMAKTGTDAGLLGAATLLMEE